jgi:hypothetical protein
VVSGHAVAQVQQHRGAPGQVQGTRECAVLAGMLLLFDSRNNIVNRYLLPPLPVYSSCKSWLPDGCLDGQLRGHAREERRVLDVGGGGVPGVEDGVGGRQLVPVGVALSDLGVGLLGENCIVRDDKGSTEDGILISMPGRLTSTL